MKRILSIAASDSGGGAGIQADIKTITALGGYAMTAVTALTVQDTCGVKAVHPVPADVVQAQIETVLRDMGADAVKIGMLYSADTVRAVAAALKKHPVPFVIVDPVMKSSSGEDLLESPALDALKTELLPQAFLVTPNLEETSCLAGIKVDSLDKMKAAAISIRQTGPRYVLITGGHLQGDCIDLL
ncbi:MAG: bifunctional hydroxymethylpyrimidine kinase/phosphomethylpyrimidine kinase, partial [Deltaproteobacteria bacterium]|nr:bifunctional hydroxymethylpyrimidine kinase/phosphomethylpyrimidine kinase [Deltaproteobacteria bacterium]